MTPKSAESAYHIAGVLPTRIGHNYECYGGFLHVACDEAFVMGTDKDYSVEEFLQILFRYVGLDWRDYVEVDPRYLYPAELNDLRANPSKARKMVG